MKFFKKKKCLIENQIESQTKSQSTVDFTKLNRDDLIIYISRRCDANGDKLLEFMELNHVAGLKEATTEQLRAYAENLYLQLKQEQEDLLKC